MYDIQQLIPHRKPFCFVDRLEEVSLEKIIAYALFPKDWDVFQGHFPDYPVVPGVILVETLAQAGGAGLKALAQQGQVHFGEEPIFFLASIDNVKFRKAVRPDQEVRLEIQTLKFSSKMIRQSGQAFVEGKLATQAQWLVICPHKSELQEKTEEINSL